jgi:hypothetical protein
MNRKYPYSKLYKFVEIDSGLFVPVYLFEDLSNSEVQNHFQDAVDKQDFEYAEECAAEARLRGFNVVLD